MNRTSYLKQKIRRSLSTKRKRMAKSAVGIKSKLIVDNLIHYCKSKNTTSVASYFTFGNEANINEFNKNVLATNGKLFLPFWSESTKSYFFSLVNDWEKDLQKGMYGIMEPIPECQIYSPENGEVKIEALFIPGVAFDLKGNRLGRGKGFYDRMLKDSTEIKIGVCYEFQLIANLPKTKHDIEMDIIITENKIYKI
ncbi:MAG: 5-formyltetrahydrofolate cyclo-ligase [Verrucomicrobiota bacterium]|nr:5-formyltetrahydrofolate cyclo-ligase [Verrucomicrobiota bacterium]